MIRNIGTALNYMDKNMMRKTLTTTIRPKMENVETVWFPNKKKHINKLQSIQRMATKIVPEMEGLQYKERLRERNL